MSGALENLVWDHIETVLLDLDGTLLDLAFDNDFWLETIPAAYAASRAISLEEARNSLTPRFRACEGTMNWYCIDYWSRELGLDIEALKRTQAARIRWLPGARDFLQRLRESGRRLVLLTNSHPRVLRLKDEQTGVTGYLDAAFSSHVFGFPKEDLQFWNAVRKVEPFDPHRSLFVDDSPAVLRTAKAAGIRWICGVRHADSARPPRVHDGITAVDSVSDLYPGPPLKGSTGVRPAVASSVPSGHPSADADDGHIQRAARQSPP
jgi:putative hydrolase of the HAD superfamily